MPNMALIPNAAAQITVLLDVVDGYPDESHKLETEMGDEPLEDGREVTDHAVARPKELSIDGLGFRHPRRATAGRSMARDHSPARIGRAVSGCDGVGHV